VIISSYDVGGIVDAANQFRDWKFIVTEDNKWDTEILKLLESDPLYSFAEWPIPTLPNVAAGIYAIWKETEFVYVGIAGHGWSETKIAKMREEGERNKGLRQRLQSHRNGRRGGDQFCLYVFDRFVLPNLSPEQISAAASGVGIMDQLTQEFIQSQLTYRFVEVIDGLTALRIERLIRSGRFNAGKPLLNPMEL